mgnify:CR=1 FL=1
MRRRFYPALLLVLFLVLAGCTMGVTRYGDLRGYVGIRVNPGIQSQEILLGEINPEDVVISSQAFDESEDNIMPLAGAKVYISGQKGYIPTEQDGIFRAYRLPVGWKTITIFHPDLRKEIIRNKLVQEGPNTLDDAIGGVGYYLVIGIEKYEYLPDAPGTVSDALSVVDVFENHTKLPGYVMDLTNRKATKENIEEAIKNIPGVTPDDYLVLYFAGRMGWDFLSPYNDNGMLDRDGVPYGAITDTELELWLREFPGDVTVILDGSESATFADGEETLPIRPLALQKPRYTVISSAGRDQNAHVIEGGHGLFTNYLVSGLSEPDERIKADRNRDGTITAHEIFEYVRMKMIGDVGEAQVPELYPERANTVILRY